MRDKMALKLKGLVKARPLGVLLGRIAGFGRGLAIRNALFPKKGSHLGTTA